YRINLDVTMPSPEPAWRDVSFGAFSSLLPPLPGAPTDPIGNSWPLFSSINRVIVDPNNSNILYVSLGVGGADRVMRAVVTVSPFTPADVVSVAWTDLTGNLPAGLVPQSLVQDPNLLPSNVPGGDTDDDIYVGTTNGVWKLHNPVAATHTWTKVGRIPDPNNPGQTSDTLPNTAVSDLTTNPSTGLLSGAPYGRGVWQFQLRGYAGGYKFEDINGDGVRQYQDLNNNGVHDVDEPWTEPPLAGFTIQAINAVTNQ